MITELKTELGNKTASYLCIDQPMAHFRHSKAHMNHVPAVPSRVRQYRLKKRTYTPSGTLVLMAFRR